MTACPACTTAATDPHAGLYRADCLDCSVRLMWNGQPFYESTKAGRITSGYRIQLERAFGVDWQEGHKRVKAGSKKIKQEII